jgi:hypothetical protein
VELGVIELGGIGATGATRCNQVQRAMLDKRSKAARSNGVEAAG